MADKPNADMAEFWNGEGGKKWVSREARFEASLEPFSRHAMEAAAIKTGERVLDIGFGCGDTSIDLARAVGPKGHVHGVDISTAMVTAAEAKATVHELKNISFECADAQISAFPSEEYDLVFSRFGVMFFDQPVAAFKNICSGIKPNGRISFMCWGKRDQNDWVRFPLEVVGQHVPLPAPPGPDVPGPFSLSQEGRAEAILDEAGFSDISVTEFHTEFVLGDDVAEALSFLMELSPSGGALNIAQANKETRAAVASGMTTLLESYLSERGVVMNAVALLITATRH